MPGQKPNWFIGFPIKGSSWCPVTENHAPEAIKLYHPDDLHITLAFLGPVSPRKASKAWKRLGKMKMEPVTVSFNQLKPFGSFATPSAYGLTLSQGRGEISEYIRHKGRRLLSAAGKKPTDRRIVPHVTIARPAKRLSKEDIYSIAEWRHNFDVPDVEVPVEEIALYTWASPMAPQRFRIVESQDLG